MKENTKVDNVKSESSLMCRKRVKIGSNELLMWSNFMSTFQRVSSISNYNKLVKENNNTKVENVKSEILLMCSKQVKRYINLDQINC